MNLRIERRDGVATVTLDRPDKLNALTEEMYDALIAGFAELAADDGVRAVVLTGAGRAFCAGIDVAGMVNRDLASGRQGMHKRARLAMAVAGLEKPVIAAVRGPAVGIGFSLAIRRHQPALQDSAARNLPGAGHPTLVTGSLIVREYDELKQDLEAHAKSLGRVLANTLVAPIIHDDVWRVFEIVSSPPQPGNHAKSVQQAEVMMVWDARNRIYVSTRPNDYPMMSDVAAVHPDLRAVLEAVRANSGGGQFAKDVEGSDMLYVVTPIVADGVALGTLVAAYAKSAFLPRRQPLGRHPQRSLPAALLASPRDGSPGP